jgi:death-on-curing protein
VSEPVFIDFEVVEEIHQASLTKFGGSSGIRDRRRKPTFHYGQGDLFDIAATYAFHLAQAQAYLDGNKRTAIGRLTFF